MLRLFTEESKFAQVVVGRNPVAPVKATTGTRGNRFALLSSNPDSNVLGD